MNSRACFACGRCSAGCSPPTTTGQGPAGHLIGDTALWHERFGGDRDVLGPSLRLDGRPTRSSACCRLRPRFPSGGRSGCRCTAIAPDLCKATSATASAGSNRASQRTEAERISGGPTAGSGTRATRSASSRRSQAAARESRLATSGRPRSLTAAVGAAARHRLRERRERHARSGARAAARNGDPRSRWAPAAASPASAVRREPDAVAASRGASDWQRAVGDAALVVILTNGSPQWAAFGLDMRVMVFATVAHRRDALLFGWAPALHAVGGDLLGRACDNGAHRGAACRAPHAELLVGGVRAGGACSSSVARCSCRPTSACGTWIPAFDIDHVLTFRVALPDSALSGRQEPASRSGSTVEGLRPLRASTPAGLVNLRAARVPPGVVLSSRRGMPAPGQADPVALNRSACADYFRAMGIRSKSDASSTRATSRQKAEPVVIVNETFAAHILSGVTMPSDGGSKGTESTHPG